MRYVSKADIDISSEDSYVVAKRYETEAEMNERRPEGESRSASPTGCWARRSVAMLVAGEGVTGGGGGGGGPEGW